MGLSRKNTSARTLRAWLIQNKMSPEELAASMRLSFYTMRNLLYGKKVSDATLELASEKTGIPFATLKSEMQSEDENTSGGAA